MRYLVPLIILSCIVSCKKEIISAPSEIPVPYSEASYTMIVSLNWQSPQFSVPATAHVTALIGMVHSKDTVLWSPDKLATKGLEDVAETGNTINMNLELDAIIARSRALSKFMLPPPAVRGTTSTILKFNTDYSYISFASMIAPSPDWFLGIHDVNLFPNKKWVDDVTLNIMLYDAGTEDGDVFGYNNPETIPQQKVSFLTPSNATVLANGNPSIYAIGTVRFMKN